MRVDSIAVQNFLGVPEFRHTLKHPLLLIAGKNGAGKSSLQDAIRYALTGELARSVKLQKDRANLITDGAASGFAEVTVDGYQVRRNIGSGATTKDEFAPNRYLPLCLDPARFASLPEAERRSVLFELSGVKVNRESVAEQLADYDGVTPEMVERVLPLLRGGFGDAEKHAKEQASQARGAWKAITGEAYGSVKAESWRAASPDASVDPAELEDAQEKVARSEARLRSLAEAKGRAEQAMSPERRAALEESAAGLPDLYDAQTSREERVRAARRAVQAATEEAALAAMTPAGMGCPGCGVLLVVQDGELRELEDAAQPEQPNPAVLQSATAELREAEAAFASIRERVRAAEGAQVALENMPPELDPEDAKAAERLDEESRAFALHKAALRAIESKLSDLDAAAGKTERAAAAHAEVKGWSAVATAMSPDGIPAVLLARALDPINAALANQAAAAGWKIPAIERDLSLSYGGRQLGLCSESEQWRANLLFTLVVAIASDVRLLAVDRFDVLDPVARGDAIDYLESLTFDQVLDTAIVSGTFKAPLTLDGVDTVWLDRGEAQQAQAA